MRSRWLFAALLLLVSRGLWAAELTTVAVAPLTTARADDAWVGIVVADDLNNRLHFASSLGTYTSRQVTAALGQADLTPASLAQTADTRRLGRELGARWLVVGTYKVAGNAVTGSARIVDVESGKETKRIALQGDLSHLAALEESLAQPLAALVGVEKLPSLVDGAEKIAVAARRDVARALMRLREHSLSPRAADPVAPVGIPESELTSLSTRLSQASAASPQWEAVWSGLALTESLRGRQAAAWQALEKATPKGRGELPETTLIKTFVRMREGRFDVAEKILRDAVAAHPGFLHARGSLAQLLIHFGRLREARAAYQRYAELVPRQPWVLAQIGYCESKLGRTDEALASTRRAVELLPGSAYLLTELASRQIDADDLKGAIATLNDVLAKRPNDVVARVRLGYVQLLAGDVASAIATSEKALTLATGSRSNRERAYAHLNLARAYGRSGKLDLAFEHLAKAKGEASISLDEIALDPSLDAMRRDPRYAKIAD